MTRDEALRLTAEADLDGRDECGPDRLLLAQLLPTNKINPIYAVEPVDDRLFRCTVIYGVEPGEAFLLDLTKEEMKRLPWVNV